MTVEQFVFIFVSLITIAAAIVVVTNRNMFHAALAMMLSFLGVAGIYITLDAGFMAAAQLLVYIGAISILIIFAIMLTRRMMQAEESPFNSQVGLGLITAGAGFVIATFTIFRYWGNPNVQTVFGQKPDVPAEALADVLTKLGESFVDPMLYALPFLVASMLLLAALIGSVFIAWPRQQIGMEEEL